MNSSFGGKELVHRISGGLWGFIIIILCLTKKKYNKKGDDKILPKVEQLRFLRMFVAYVF